MADNSSEGLERQIRPEFERGRNRLADQGGNVADADSTGPQRQLARQHNPKRWEKQNEPIGHEGGAGLPYFAPGPNGARWAEIIQEHPSLKPALCRIFNGLAPKLDEVLNEARHNTQASWARYFFGWKELSRMRLHQIVAPSSRELQQASGCGYPLRDLSQSAPSPAEECELKNLQYQLQAQEVEKLYNMWEAELFEAAWNIIVQSEMGWEGHIEDLHILQYGVSIQASTSDHLQSNLFEQVSLGSKKMRTDQLRAAGNGVCSMAGAIAWLSLSAHFE